MKEFELIRKIAQASPFGEYGVKKGIGDDCAVLSQSSDKELLVTTDGFFEGIHFKREWISPRLLGRKALAVNISDIAAMGGHPLFYLVTIGIPENFPAKDIEDIFGGMAQMAKLNKMGLIGGDTCKSKSGLVLSITVIGECSKGKAILRSGAKDGDILYVTGTIGGSGLGLLCYEKGLKGLHYREFLKMADDPVPRASFGEWLSASNCASSMIDISDGLAQDVGHLAEESRVSIEINVESLPLPEEFDTMASSLGKDPIVLALTGGEDYELAFTVPREKQELFEKMLKVVLPTFDHKVTKIGEVCEGEGVTALFRGKELQLKNLGFEHKWND